MKKRLFRPEIIIISAVLLVLSGCLNNKVTKTEPKESAISAYDLRTG